MSETFNEYYTRVSSKARRKSLEDELGIVRCKECKYWENKENAVWCRRTAIGIFRMEADDFCSKGEKK